jgi:ribosomal protein S18 acetylase RimI-like enzyme
MAENLVIRACTTKDEAAFIRLNTEFMQEAMTANPYWGTLGVPSPEEMGRIFREALAARETIQVFLAEVNGKPVGYANTWTVYSVWSGGLAFIVDDLYIAPDYRNRGIGEDLMKYLIHYAQERNYRRIQLHAESNNHTAHGLYRKLSFQEEEILFFMKRI